MPFISHTEEVDHTNCTNWIEVSLREEESIALFDFAYCFMCRPVMRSVFCDAEEFERVLNIEVRLLKKIMPFPFVVRI